MARPRGDLAREVADAFDVPRVLIGLTEPEDTEHDRLARLRWLTELAWRDWRLESCSEFNGGHAPMLAIDHGSIKIECEHGCPLELDDFYPDGADLVCAFLPVSVRVNTARYSNPSYGDEWDAWVDLEPRDV